MNNEQSKPQIVVAVYGTLKRGFGNHRLLEKSAFLKESKLKGTMYSLGPFPALSLHGNTDVHVEMYEIDEPTLQSLDRLEGHPSFYQRQKVHAGGLDAWVYTMDHDQELSNMPIVKSGNWGE